MITEGMKVKIKKSSEFFGQCFLTGTVNKVRPGKITRDKLVAEVSFPNGFDNTYFLDDLEEAGIKCPNESKERIKTSLSVMLEGVDLHSLADLQKSN